jgi:hypothetical protein
MCPQPGLPAGCAPARRPPAWTAPGACYGTTYGGQCGAYACNAESLPCALHGSDVLLCEAAKCAACTSVTRSAHLSAGSAAPSAGEQQLCQSLSSQLWQPDAALLPAPAAALLPAPDALQHSAGPWCNLDQLLAASYIVTIVVVLRWLVAQVCRRLRRACREQAAPAPTASSVGRTARRQDTAHSRGSQHMRMPARPPRANGSKRHSAGSASSPTRCALPERRAFAESDASSDHEGSSSSAIVRGALPQVLHWEALLAHAQSKVRSAGRVSSSSGAALSWHKILPQAERHASGLQDSTVSSGEKLSRRRARRNGARSHFSSSEAARGSAAHAACQRRAQPRWRSRSCTRACQDWAVSTALAADERAWELPTLQHHARPTARARDGHTVHSEACPVYCSTVRAASSQHSAPHAGVATGDASFDSGMASGGVTVDNAFSLSDSADTATSPSSASSDNNSSARMAGGSGDGVDAPRGSAAATRGQQSTRDRPQCNASSFAAGHETCTLSRSTGAINRPSARPYGPEASPFSCPAHEAPACATADPGSAADAPHRSRYSITGLLKHESAAPGASARRSRCQPPSSPASTASSHSQESQRSCAAHGSALAPPRRASPPSTAVPASQLYHPPAVAGGSNMLAPEVHRLAGGLTDDALGAGSVQESLSERLWRRFADGLREADLSVECVLSFSAERAVVQGAPLAVWLPRSPYLWCMRDLSCPAQGLWLSRKSLMPQLL